MKSRIAGLIVLAILASASLYFSSFWTRQTIEPLNRAALMQAEYRSWYWLVTCAVFGAAWIWLLVKTIRYRAEDYQ
ncbi:MAG: hypothetical protein H7Z14_19715 [Anaerolineae bacterium]|nr:hypothetical protein [Phycisphaerae bacterium]